MKKLFISAIILMIALSIVPMSTFAADDKLTVEELIGEWTDNGYPDNVGGVYWNGDADMYVILLVNTDDEHRNEILTQVSNQDSLLFEKATYSFNSLLAVYNEIAGEFNEYGGIYSVGINGRENCVEVSADTNDTDEYSALFKKQYGDIVRVKAGSPIVADTAKADTVNMRYLPVVITVISIFLILLTSLLYFRFRTKLMVTDENTLITSKPISRKDIVKAIKENSEIPNEAVLQCIRSRIGRLQ